MSAPEDTRNFAVVGHSKDGKTSLSEAILYRAGATHTLGKVDDGTSVFDSLPEEKERKTSLSSAFYGFDHDGKHITLVDTPGDPNFQADGRIALEGLDGAVLVVSGNDGAKVGTETMWRAAKRTNVPVIAFVNGMDRVGADFDAAVESLRKMDLMPAVVAQPLGSGDDFRGVLDLLHQKLLTADGATDVPADQVDEVEAGRLRLVESVAECDDTLLEKYLDEGELSDEEMIQGLLASTREGKLVPVTCGSAIQPVGADLLLRCVGEILPSPVERGAWAATDVAGDGEKTVEPDPSGPLTALVLKKIIDRYAGTLSVIRVVSGTLSPDSTVLNATTGEKERLGKLLALRGSEHSETGAIGPGGIVAVAKLKNTHTGNAITQEKGGVRLRELYIPHGVLSYAITAREKGDEDKLFSSLARLVEEDPTLDISRDPSTGEFLLTGMGELHIRMTVHKLQRLFNVNVDLKTPKVPYRETILGKAEKVEGKLKKQTGGKGMFGVCYLSVEPLPRGEGFEFVDEIVGGSIPRNLIPAVEKGIREGLAAGPLAGYPVVDLRVRCIDGKHHSVDSNEMAFKLAGSFGFKAAVEKARPTLLEPIMNAEVSIPDESVGDIMGDISGRRGRVQSTESRGSGTVIKAQVPMAEMLEYASALTSLTGGKGTFHMEFSHYEETPAQIREKVIAEAKAAASAES